MDSPIEFTIDGPVATITLNRPGSHNALMNADLMRLIEIADELADNEAVRAVILTGAGESTFCSGASLSELTSVTAGAETHPLETVTKKIEALPQITLCALNGSVYGGGVELALSCDFRIGKPGIRSFVPPARVGIHYPPNGLRLLETRLGLGPAKRLILAGDTFDEEDLRQTGFCDWWVGAGDDPMGLAHAKAREIAGFAPLATQGMKRCLNEIANADLDEQRAYEEAARCWASDDLKEGLKARAEKRPPIFKGR